MNGKIVYNRHIGHYSNHHHDTSPGSNGSKVRSLRAFSHKAKKGKKKKKAMILSASLRNMQVPDFSRSYSNQKQAHSIKPPIRDPITLPATV